MICTVYDDGDNSHFKQTDVSFSEKDFAPPAAPLQVSEFGAAKKWGMLILPVDWDGSWHPTPVRQLIVCLSGKFEITVGDGRMQQFGPGEMVLLEDTRGRGHATKVVGSLEVRCLAVQL